MTFDWLYQSQDHKKISIIDGQVYLYPLFVETVQADAYLQKLLSNIQWQSETINMYGKQIQVPRLVAWYGDSGMNYRYSNIDHEALPWTDELSELKALVESALRHDFNSVLLNLYRNGADSVAWHADDEDELGNEPVIASLTFGAEREFQFKNKSQPGDKIKLRLPHGSLLLMSGKSQTDWLHQLPKMRGMTEPRINLTFRKLIKSKL